MADEPVEPELRTFDGEALLAEDEEAGPASARYRIDRRPIGLVLISRLKNQLRLAFFFAVFAWLLGLTPPEGLTHAGWSTVVVFGLCATLWATNALPMAITSLLAIALVPMLGILDARHTYAYFGSKVVFFILGAFMLAAALIATGLSARLATLFIRRFGRTPRQLVISLFFLCATASTLMSIHAVAAMVFPIAWDIAKALKLKRPGSQLGRALFFALMWGCIIGGSLTVLGGGRGPLAIGLLEEATGEASSIGFVEYITYTAPLVAVMLLAGAFALYKLFEPEVGSTQDALDVLEIKLRSMGKMLPREQVTGLVVIATVVLWALAGDSYGLANIAICSMAALFALGTLSWQDVQRHVNWGIVVMYGGAICLGGVMETTGAAEWITQTLLADMALAPQTLMLALALIAAVLTEFMSNSAVVAMMMPPALSLAASWGIDPRAMTMVIVIPSNFAFMFPISTPVTGIAWSAGFFTPRLAGATGVMMHLVGWLAMALLIYGYWPAIGLL